MKSLIRSLTLLAIVGVFVGCSQRIGDFTVISSKNFQVGAKYKKVGRHSGEDMKAWFIIPFGIPDLKNAVDRAIENGNGVYLANVVLENKNQIFKFGYVVTGDVFAPASQGDLSDPNVELYSFDETDGKRVLSNGTDTIEIME